MRCYWARSLTAALAAALVSVVLLPMVTAAQAAPGAAAGPAPAPAPAPASASPLETPVLSLRRAPALLALAVATSTLDAGLDAALSDPRYGKVSAHSCLVVQDATLPIYSHNPTLPVIPASNLKLLTATAALDKLPATDRFVTTVESAAVPANGTINGDLYLVGGGDPLLFTPGYVASLPYPALIYDNIDTLADQVRAAGVTKVTGSVIGDESRYDTQRGVATWSPSYLASGEVGPLSALEVNDGFSSFEPRDVAAAQPAEQAAATFTTLLQAAGVTVSGAPGAGTAPATAAKITELSSSPLPAVVDEVLRRSDDDGAELITKELGRDVSGSPTTTAGVAVIQADIAADGLPTAGLHMADGSGLDRSDRVTCQLVLATLLRSGPNGAVGQGLALAGKTGTLFQRMVGTPAAGRLRAKTGTLDGVSALSGFVSPAPPASATNAVDPSGVAFSLIGNSVASNAAGDALGNRVGVLLAQFPQAPPLAELAPLP